ncbi:glycoside hydrolase family 3 N-terminal domain-containing protein [Microbacterium sp. SSW1-59]|uniref:glycoside hydrolase family 3 N-terminal domain-containing protein n=1 Tax=Microbacterium xanthum TaxID=3079794 RepID=UPI002AD2E4EC|nr:glycoside hydrolase family 3 N-terminal domain-containing protein [Microbacterium sp. SSW1-59]MDZ8201864.1 glycoside hydrolase family 3 N-terminal domain-containing protein [Microbacterium sp. SSW1-59]
MPGLLRAVVVAVGLAGLLGSLPLGAGAVRQAPSPGGAPVTVHAADASDRAATAAAIVGTMTLREQAASVVMGHLPTTDHTVLRDYMATDRIGGFILMGANVPATEDGLREVTAALTVDDELPPLVAIDQEGGDVSRLPWDDLPAASTLKSSSPAEVEAAFAARAALVERGGASVNFGIVADVTSDPAMFIYRRALGTEPDIAAAHVAAAVRGEAGRTASTLKHFPGHGAAPGDSHVGIPTTDMPREEWLATQAPPFVAGIEAGADLLMFGHLTYSEVDAAPASLSARWHSIAREELGFDGVTITDDLGMLQASGIAEYADPVANGVAALVAGNDMVLTVLYSDADSARRMVDGIVAAVESGALDRERLVEASERVTALRLSTSAGLIPCDTCVGVG